VVVRGDGLIVPPEPQQDESATVEITRFAGIVRETTGRARGRIFAYVRYLDALNAEIETPPP
jgi:hypothetical protein